MMSDESSNVIAFRARPQRDPEAPPPRWQLVLNLDVGKLIRGSAEGVVAWNPEPPEIAS